MLAITLFGATFLAISFLLWVLFALTRERAHHFQYRVHLCAFPREGERAITVLKIEDEVVAASQERLSARWSYVLS